MGTVTPETLSSVLYAIILNIVIFWDDASILNMQRNSKYTKCSVRGLPAALILVMYSCSFQLILV